MGHRGFNRQWAAARRAAAWHQHGRRGGPWGGPWGGPGGFGPPGHAGPPPWVAGLFGLAPGRARTRSAGTARRRPLRDPGRGPHRAAATARTVNGYQVIQQIAERSGGAWTPSPGSVYPTIQQLAGRGPARTVEQGGRRRLTLTAEGRTYVAERADELAAVWAPFDRSPSASDEPASAPT